MNNISIVGRVTKDIEVQSTPAGIDFCRFNVAVQSEFKTPDGERKVDFFPCVAWRENAKNIAKYFKKGYPIGVIGSMNSRSYETADGSTQKIWELNVKNFSFVGSSDDKEEKEEKTESKKKKSKSKTPEITPVDLDDDDNLPF